MKLDLRLFCKLLEQHISRIVCPWLSSELDIEPAEATGDGDREEAELKTSDDSDGNSEDEEDDDDDDVAAPPPEGMYDPSDYEYLNVSTEIKDLFNYIVRYTPQTIEIETRFKPFIPEYIPAVGDIDAFIKGK